MKLVACMCTLVVLATNLWSQAHASEYSGRIGNGNFTRRDTHMDIRVRQAPSDQDIAGRFMSAVIDGDNTESFCSMLLISDSVGVAAATCFEPGIDYSRYGFVTGGEGDNAYMKLKFMSLTKHPNFNPATFSNNIAVVTFQPIPAQNTNRHAVAAVPSQWTRNVLVQRSLDSGGGWANRQLAEVAPGDAAACNSGSGLYQANPGDFVCSTQVINSLYTANCVIPYQLIDSSAGGDIAQMALYSHSSVQDDNKLCTNTAVYNYYINVANYIPWINQVSGASANRIVLLNAPSVPSNPQYQMVEPTVASSANRKVISLFHQEEYLYLAAPAVPPPAPSELIIGQPNIMIPYPVNFNTGQLAIPAVSRVPTKPSTSVTTTTTTTTVSATSTSIMAPTTASATATQTTTSIVPSTVATTATASETTTSSTTSTTTLVTTTTATSTVSDYVTLTSIVVSESVTTSTATATLTSTTTIQSVCPAVTQCPPVAAPGKSTTTVTQTATATSTLVLTSYNFQVATVAGTGGPAPGTLFATVTFTATETAATATQVVTVLPASSPTITSTTTVHVVVSSTTTTLAGKPNSHASTSTTTSTVVSVESPGAAPATPPQPWAIALTIVIAILALLALSFLVFLCCRRKKVQHVNAFTDYEYPPLEYPPDYYAHGGDEKANDGYFMESTYNRPEANARRSRYNSRGSYVGYIGYL